MVRPIEMDLNCPHCHKTLMDPTVRIDDAPAVYCLIQIPGPNPRLSLSAYLNVTTQACTIEVPRSKELADLRCSHCDHTLLVTEPACAACGSRTAMFLVAAMCQLVKFHICLRMGCNGHGLSAEDSQILALEDSAEW